MADPTKLLEKLSAVPQHIEAVRQDMPTQRELDKAVRQIKIFVFVSSTISSGLTMATLYFIIHHSKS